MNVEFTIFQQLSFFSLSLLANFEDINYIVLHTIKNKYVENINAGNFLPRKIIEFIKEEILSD